MKILLAIDGSDSADAAIEFLCQWALPQDSEIVLMTVINREALDDGNREGIDDRQLQTLEQAEQMLREQAEEILAAAETRIAAPGPAPQKVIASGHPAYEIIRTAADQCADIVMMGTHGFGTVKRFLLGSTSDAVVLYAPCSVLIVRDRNAGAAKPAESAAGKTPGPRPLSILLAFDNSRSARKATRFCAKLSSLMHREVIALSVLPLMHMFRQDFRQQLSWVWQERKKAAAKGLEWVEKTLKPASSRVSTLLQESADVSEAILDTAAQGDCDLIVIGNRGESRVKQFLMGSVTRGIIHHAPCSVLAVRKPRD